MNSISHNAPPASALGTFAMIVVCFLFVLPALPCLVFVALGTLGDKGIDWLDRSSERLAKKWRVVTPPDPNTGLYTREEDYDPANSHNKERRS